MPLLSKLFRDDQRLQACLVDHAAHVTPGARGDHVRKIQIAVEALGDQLISDDEISTKTYGPSTTSAVLAYKRKRAIINFSYQTQADNVVGKMTIASLDQAMQKLENPPEAQACVCRWNQKHVG
jgi:hypothetical protein